MAGILAERRASGQKARRRYIVAGLSALMAVLVTGSLIFAFSRHPAADAPVPSTVTRNRAVNWATAQVSPTSTVACDPAMCQAFKARGFAASRLLELRHGTAALLRSDVVVATPEVRSMFGGRLNSVYAPGVIASFGSGNMRIDIRAIAVHGAAAYWNSLGADMKIRQALGSSLLGSRRVTASATARKQINNEQVDSRLLVTIAEMASVHPVYIAAFGDSAPGAGQGSPLRSADLSQGSEPPRLANAAFLRAMVAFLHGRNASYHPASIKRTRFLPGGSAGLRIEFAAPSPLGLPAAPAS